MHRQISSYTAPCVSEQREYVKLQYGRKIAQDTCMLASMKTPDWSQTPPGFIGRHNSVPCTVTTNSSSSNLKMYPYTVYSCACHSDHHRCQKFRGNCVRHRCLSGSAVHVLIPASSHDQFGGQHQALMRSQVLEATVRNGLSRPLPLLVPQPGLTKLTSLRPSSNFHHNNHPHPSSHHQQHSQQQQQHVHQPVSCLQNQHFNTQQLLGNLGFQSISSPSSHQHHRVVLNQDVMQRH